MPSKQDLETATKQAIDGGEWTIEAREDYASLEFMSRHKGPLMGMTIARPQAAYFDEGQKMEANFDYSFELEEHKADDIDSENSAAFTIKIDKHRRPVTKIKGNAFVFQGY